MKRWQAVVGMGMLAVSVAQAEPRRVLLTHENRLPEKGELEVEGAFILQENQDEREQFTVEDVDWRTYAVAARYGLARDLKIGAVVPFSTWEPDEGDGEAGFNDIQIEAELRAFEDVFGYPYILPYLRVSLPTGDEDKDLGDGDPSYTFGAAVGTTVLDDLHYALDLAYTVRGSSENVASVGGSIIWDLNDRCSLVGEGKFTEKLAEEEENSKILLGGLIYRPAPVWLVGLYGGKDMGGDPDMIAAVRVNYTFE